MRGAGCGQDEECAGSLTHRRGDRSCDIRKAIHDCSSLVALVQGRLTSLRFPHGSQARGPHRSNKTMTTSVASWRIRSRFTTEAPWTAVSAGVAPGSFEEAETFLKRR